MGLFSFLRPKPKTKGCLFNKTEQQKVDFFKSLSKFATTDEMFFKEQYSDLQPHEKKEFGDWIIKDREQSEQILKMVKIIGQLLEEKNNAQPGN